MRQFVGIGIAVLAVVGGLGVAYYSMWLQSKARQMKHRERMAMIEKGIAPPALMESAAINGVEARKRRSSGVFLICVGIGLALMMGLSKGDTRQLWIGGFVALIGVANLVNSVWDERDRRKARSGAPQITSSTDQ